MTSRILRKRVQPSKKSQKAKIASRFLRPTRLTFPTVRRRSHLSLSQSSFPGKQLRGCLFLSRRSRRSRRRDGWKESFPVTSSVARSDSWLCAGAYPALSIFLFLRPLPCCDSGCEVGVGVGREMLWKLHANVIQQMPVRQSLLRVDCFGKKSHQVDSQSKLFALRACRPKPPWSWRTSSLTPRSATHKRHGIAKLALLSHERALYLGQAQSLSVYFVNSLRSDRADPSQDGIAKLALLITPAARTSPLARPRTKLSGHLRNSPVFVAPPPGFS